MIIWVNLIKTKKDIILELGRNYLIENNTLYFTGYAGKKNCKFRFPFLTEKNSIISNAHINNGHLGINHTIENIKENGFFWEYLMEDVNLLLIIVLNAYNLKKVNK